MSVPHAATALATCLLATCVTGCGLMFQEKEQIVTIDSAPSGATLNFAGHEMKTPATVKLSRHSGILIARASKEDHAPVCEIVYPSADALLVTLDSIPVALGLAIDALAGTWPSKYPDVIELRLQPAYQRVPPDSLPSDQAIIEAWESAAVDLCDPRKRLGLQPPAIVSPAPEAEATTSATEEKTRPAEALSAHVDDVMVTTASLSMVRQAIFGLVEVHTERPVTPAALDKLLKLKAIELHGAEVDAVINVSYDTGPAGRQSAKGLAVRFVTQ